MHIVCKSTCAKVARLQSRQVITSKTGTSEEGWQKFGAAWRGPMGGSLLTFSLGWNAH